VRDASRKGGSSSPSYGLTNSIATHRQLFRGLEAQRTGSVTRAARILDSGSKRGITDWRRMRAQVADTARRCEFLRAAVVGIEQDIATGEPSSSGTTLIPAVTVRNLSPRKDALERARLQNPAEEVRSAIRAVKGQQADVARKTLHARKVLVRETIAVFGVQQRLSSEWEIAGLALPPPDAMRGEQ